MTYDSLMGITMKSLENRSTCLVQVWTRACRFCARLQTRKTRTYFWMDRTEKICNETNLSSLHFLIPDKPYIRTSSQSMSKWTWDYRRHIPFGFVWPSYGRRRTSWICEFSSDRLDSTIHCEDIWKRTLKTLYIENTSNLFITVACKKCDRGVTRAGDSSRPVQHVLKIFPTLLQG